MELGHNTSGKIFRIEYNSKLGRHLVASRDIEVGELIIDDYPLVLGPSTFIDPNPKSNSGSLAHIPVCPACYRKLSPTTTNTVVTDSGNPVTKTKLRDVDTRRDLLDDSDDEEEWKEIFLCSDCGLKLCSERCSQNPIHTENECKIFKNIPLLHAKLENRAKDLHQFITTVRCLFLKSNDPIKWTQIKELQSHTEELTNLGLFDGVNSAFSLLSWNDFQDDKPDGNIISEDIVQMAKHCLGTLRTNAFSRFSSKVSIECLYFFSSFMAHNCLMNTDRYFDMDGVRLVTRAATKILKGQPITTTYLSHLNNNVERQREMRSVWSFTCDCERCCDETECGTFLSTVVCPSCNSLTLNPNFIGNSEDCKWLCSNQNCLHIPSDLEIQGHLQSTLGTVESNQPDITDLKASEEWLRVFDNGKFLHSNHSILIQVKLYLCQEYGSNRGICHLTDEELLRKRNLCKEVLGVLNKLLREAHLLRGIILFELWLSLQEIRIRNERNNYKIDNNVTDGTIQDIGILAKEVLQFGSRNSVAELMFNIILENE